MFEVTLKALRTKEACFSGYNKVVRALQGKEFTEADDARETYIRFAHSLPISIESIVASNRLDDALWALRCVEGEDRNMRLFAVWCARQVEHLMMDERSKNALNVVESLANGLATQDELSAARAAARASAEVAARAAARASAEAAAEASAEAAAEAAAWAARDAAAEAAAWAARDAARDAAGSAACDAARDAACDAAWNAACDAAWNAAWNAARGAQTEMLIKMCRGQAPWQVQQPEG